MRRGRMRGLLGLIGAVVLLGIAGAAAFAYWPARPGRPVVPPPPSAELIERGRYVAVASDCVACHTAPGGQPWTGGRAFKLPFGTLYAPNITPDRETGIGAWTASDLVRALHRGVGRDGRDLYPAFPYTSYIKMTDEDALALYAYLMSLKPVRAKAPENALIFPFNQRPLMRFWKLLFLRGGQFRPDPARPAEWNRGAYLVTGLAHCGECHTPRNLMFGMDEGRALSGETLQGWTAWNITADRQHGTGAWSPSDLTAYFHYGFAPGRGAASGPMKEAVDLSLSQMTPQDLAAMATYLATTKPVARGPIPNPNVVSLTASTFDAPPASEPDSDGRKLFAGACAGCHAWNGEGRQSQIAQLRGLKSVADPTATNVIQAILGGNSVSAPQGKAFMPSFGRAYSDAEIAAISGYVVRHFGGQAGKVEPRQVAAARQD